MREGFAIHLYTCNESMQNSALANADGHFLIVPQQGVCVCVQVHLKQPRNSLMKERDQVPSSFCT